MSESSTAMNRERLAKLKRPELQKLAKTHGVRANLKNDAIITLLLEHFIRVPSDAVAQEDAAVGSAQQAEKTEPAALPALATSVRRAMKKRRAPRAPSPKALPKDAGPSEVTEASPSGPDTEAFAIAPDNLLGLINGPPPARVSRLPNEGAAAPASIPLAAATNPTDAPAPHRVPPTTKVSSVGIRADGQHVDIKAPAPPHGQGPFFSISTGVSRGAVRQKPNVHPREAVPNLAEAVSRALRSSKPPHPERVTYADLSDEARAEFDQSMWSHNGPAFHFPSHVPTNYPNTWTPSTAPPSRARANAPASANGHGLVLAFDPTAVINDVMWPYVPEPEQEQEPQPEPEPEPVMEQEGPLASMEDMEAVVRKVMDLSRVHKQRWAEVNAHAAKAAGLARTATNLRTLVRQESAHRVRMQNFLSYWNKVQPRWNEAEIWDKVYPTRIDEIGCEVEILSDEEDFVDGEFARPPGAKATEIVERRYAYRRDSEDQDVRVSEVLELTADRKLAPAKPSNTKRRRCTPMDDLNGAERPTKKARAVDTPAKASGTAGTVPAAVVPPLGAIMEDGEDETV